jgi:hypothetical protein
LAYRDGFSPSSNLLAVFPASLKAALIGSTIVTFFATLSFGLPSVDLASDIFRLFGTVAFVFVICLFTSTIVITLLLMIFGLAIAYLARDVLTTATGSAIALASAVALSALVAILLGGLGGIIFVLPFSIPAAILFRREILLESTFP